MKNYKCTVSVVIPCFNAEKFIAKAIQSVLEQTLKTFEILVIDDGSTDLTVHTIEKIQDERIKLIRLKRNKGNYYARNIGMEIAVGKYICVLDADDVAHKNRLEKQVEYLENFPDIGLVASNFIVIDESGVKISQRELPETHSRLKVTLLRNNFILHSSLMFRSEIIINKQYFYNETLPYAADYDFLVRISDSFKIACMQEYLSIYRYHDNQISKTKFALQRDIANDVRKNQFQRYGIHEENDISTLNKFMLNEPLYDWEIELVLDLLNQILEVNKEFTFFDQDYFIKYYQKCFDNTKLIQI